MAQHSKSGRRARAAATVAGGIGVLVLASSPSALASAASGWAAQGTAGRVSGLVTLAPLGQSSCAPGTNASDAVATLGISVGAVGVSATGLASDCSGSAASASVAGATIAGLGLGLIQSTCATGPYGASGSSQVLDLAGHPVVSASRSLGLGIGTVSFNQQRVVDGQLVVDAVSATLFAHTPLQEDVVLGESVCALAPSGGIPN
jgi:hypothetical protein